MMMMHQSVGVRQEINSLAHSESPLKRTVETVESISMDFSYQP
jgi:hypothetical protein